MSKFAGFIVGAIMVGVGVLTGNPLLIIQGAAMIVTQGVVLLTMKSPARQASEMSIALGEQPRSALFGECFTAGSLVDAFDYGGKYGTDWECLVIRLADHKCDSLTGFYVNDTYVTYTGDGNYTQFENANTGRDGLHLYFRADTSSEALPAALTSNGPGWTAADIGQSGCDVIVFYQADKAKAKKPVWPGGRPRFGFVVKGKLCYDPRLDSTVGGSGAHRWDDPSTWEWSENAAVCRYNWVRGIYSNDQVNDPAQLLIGRGLSAQEAPPANVFAAANLCDETVDGAARYRVAGPVYSNQTFLEVEEMFAVATGGSVITHEGSVELEPGAAKSVVASFTDEDLLAGSKVTWNGAVLSDSDGGWINTVVANYVEPTQQWNQHDAPVVRDESDILADAGPRETQLSLRLVKWVGQAQRVAEITRRLGRIWGRAQVTLGPRFCEIEAGDWVQWQSDRRFGGATRTFRVEVYSIDEKWQNTLTLREISSSVFGDGAVFEPDYSEATPTPPPPDIGAPTGAQWALAAVTLTSAGVDVPALEISGDAGDDESVDEILFEYWKDDGVINPVTDPDDPTWSVFGTFSPETTKVEITSIEGGADYYAAVTYVVSGEPGDRLVLGPVTTANIDVSDAVNPLISEAITGLPWKAAVRARTTAALPANTYANGTSGVGATLTGNANGALAAQDGVTLVSGDRLLVADEAAGLKNGIYTLTQVGDASNPYILTRTIDADSAAELVCATVKVSEGSTNGDSEWMCSTNAPIVVGTTALTFTQPAGGGGDSNIYDTDWLDVTAYGATGDGTTDDTAAIQAAIDACEAAGGGTVYFPRGTYVVNGALQDTSESNSQLLLPRRDYGDTEAITIALRGEAPPSAVASVIGATPLQNNLSVIKGTLNTGTGSLIGAHGPAGTLEDYTNILAVFRDLTFQMPANPALSCLDLSKCSQIDVDNVQIHTGSFDVAGLAIQTTSTSYGLRTPGLNNGALTRLGNVNVIGFYSGYEIGEHCVGQNVTAWGCKRGFVFVAGYHSSVFTRMQTAHCQTPITFTGGEHTTNIQELNIEHAASGTWVTTNDIDDASNYARGSLLWHTVLAGTGPVDTFTVSGAKYIKRSHLSRQNGVFTLVDGATVTIDCNIASNFRWGIGGNRTFANPTAPYDGQVINVRIIQDGSGSRTWTLGSKFKFAGGSPALSTAANAKDFVSCQYDAADDTWNCAISKGMA